MEKRPQLDILLCAPRGFCAGVDRAIQIVELALQKYGLRLRNHGNDNSEPANRTGFVTQDGCGFDYRVEIRVTPASICSRA